jgi:hypothetical protein
VLIPKVKLSFFGIRKIYNNNGVNMSFTIGCDPELVLRKNGKFVSASNYYKKNASFGLDGCNSIAELRPGYSESPIDLTAKIKIILEYGHEKHPELEMFAGHYQDSYPIGGHLHLILPTKAKTDRFA